MHCPILVLFIVDASVVVAMYVCSFGGVYIGIRVGKANVKSRRYQEPMAFMYDMSCVAASRILFKKMANCSPWRW